MEESPYKKLLVPDPSDSVAEILDHVTVGDFRKVLSAVDVLSKLFDSMIESQVATNRQMDALTTLFSNEVKTIYEKISAIPFRAGNPGKDAEPPTDERLNTLIKKHIPTVENGKPGKDAEITDEHIGKIVKRLAKILGKKSGDAIINIHEVARTAESDKKALTVKEIDGLEQTLQAFRNQLDRRGGYIHGGGDTIKAGSGVIVTSNPDGTKSISAAGGISIETPSGTIDGSNTTFTVLNAPIYISVDGLNKFENVGYTYLAGTITIIDGVPPADSICSFHS